MADTMHLWNQLGKTDPNHTKTFKRAGGFQGTAIKPMWVIQRMTEKFGACGKGWGMNQPEFQVVDAGGQVLVYCTVSVWYGAAGDTVWGVGGDKVQGENKYGKQFDDEAFKKAYTDAILNALKYIGIGADIHMGLFYDSKYVATVQQEFNKPQSSAQLKRDQVWPEFEQALNEVENEVQLESLKREYRVKVKEQGWSKAWIGAMADAFSMKLKVLETMTPISEAAE